MAEYDDRGEDYGEGVDYSDPSEYYEGFDWNDRYDNDNLTDLMKELNEKINELNNEWKKKRKPETRKAVEIEIQKYQNRLRFLQNLEAYKRNWNPNPNQKTKVKTEIGILEKELRDTTSSLNKCRREDSKNERKEKIDMISKTLNIYKKSFSLIKKKSAPNSKSLPPGKTLKSLPPVETKKRLPTKPVPMERSSPLPTEEFSAFSAGKEAAGFLKSALGYGWWGAKKTVGGAGVILKTVGDASITTGNFALGATSAFRQNPEVAEKEAKQHREIDKETEENNEQVVRRIDVISSKEFYEGGDQLKYDDQEIKTAAQNIAIEKNNLEGEKRKEEATRKLNEELNKTEELRRQQEEQIRVNEENKRKNEEKKRKNFLEEKLNNLGQALSENEEIRIEEEDLRQIQENNRQLNENERQSKEDTRQTFENLRQSDEKIRQELDNNRKIYWENMLTQKEEWLKEITHNNNLFKELLKAVDNDELRRQKLDKQINENEDRRLGNETVRFENEKDRKDNEEQRIKNENQRIQNEKLRVEAEAKRVAAEKNRVSGESNRVAEETKRQEQELNRIEQEEQRFISENERVGNEKARNSMEKIRISSEKRRIENEEKRNNFFKKHTADISDQKSKLEDSEKGRKEREQIFQQNEKQRIENEKLREKAEKRRNWIQQANLKILETRKNKLDEIEMKVKKQTEEPEPQKSFETFFTNRENTTEWIEDPKFREKVNKILDNIENEEPETFANALLDGISQMENITLTSEWEKRINLEEKEKFLWETRIKNINEALFFKEVVINPGDPHMLEFLRKNLRDSYTKGSENKEEKIINGFFFQDKKIIKRNIKRNFIPIEGPDLDNFISQLKNVDKNADSVIAEEIGFFSNSEVNREMAEDYIQELRNEQREMIRRGTEENGEFFEMEEFNEINKDVEKIRKNKKFKIRPKIWARSLGGFVSRLFRWVKLYVKNHAKQIGIGFLIAAFGSTLSYFTVGKVFRNIRDNMHKWKKEIPEKLKKVLEEDLPEILKHYLGDYYGLIIGSIIGSFVYYARYFLLSAGEYVGYLGWDIVKIFGKIILYFQTYISLGLTFTVGYLIFDNLGIISRKLMEESYYMRNQDPPEELIQERAEDEKMSVPEYKKKFVTKKRNWNSNIAKIASYPVSAAGKAGELTSKGGNKVLEWFLEFWGKFGIWIGIGLVILIIIKWRT